MRSKQAIAKLYSRQASLFYFSLSGDFGNCSIGGGFVGGSAIAN